jgi:hypothetical protein
MAVAAPKRRSSAAPAPAPSRTAPPKRRKAAPGPSPIRRTKGAAAPATVPTRRAPARHAPARAPQRARPKTRRSGGQLIPIAVARSAGAVRQLPDSGLVVRMTRGRAWIAVLGVLLVGIVALNVVTLSFAASSGKIDAEITSLEKDLSATRGRLGTLNGAERIGHLAAAQGLAMSTEEKPLVIEYSRGDVGTAAARLAGAE